MLEDLALELVEELAVALVVELIVRLVVELAAEPIAEWSWMRGRLGSRLWTTVRVEVWT